MFLSPLFHFVLHNKREGRRNYRLIKCIFSNYFFAEVSFINNAQFKKTQCNALKQAFLVYSSNRIELQEVQSLQPRYFEHAHMCQG